MAELQWENEQRLISHGFPLIFFDTEMVNFKIWSNYRFGRVDKIISALIEQQTFELVLICYPDLEWKEDPLRENPHDREMLFNLFLDYHISLGSAYEVVHGTGEKRFEQARSFVESTLALKG